MTNNPSPSLLDRALYILSRRDHSEAELRRKLMMPTARERRKHTPPAEPLGEDAAGARQAELDDVIGYCLQHDWLNDHRFTLSYVNSRSKKGYGEQKIRMELRQKGVDRDTIDAAFAETGIDRSAQARSVAFRKFGSPLPTDRLLKVKVQRYLLSRGFSFEEIQSIYINL